MSAEDLLKNNPVYKAWMGLEPNEQNDMLKTHSIRGDLFADQKGGFRRPLKGVFEKEISFN